VPVFKVLAPGDPAPWFRARSLSRLDFAFDTVAGRYLVLAFFGAASDPVAQAALAQIVNAPEFDDVHASVFAVTTESKDEHIVRDRIPGLRWFLDLDGAISRLYGAGAEGDQHVYRRSWIILDPSLRVIAVVPFAADSASADKLIALIRDLPPPSRHTGADTFPPVLVLPNVLEPDLCQTLIRGYQAHGGEESGFMRDIGGRTVLVQDHAHKRRRDFIVADPNLIKTLQQRVQRRIVPEIAKAFQFQVTRMERYLVGCYRADEGGHFRPHRDNTTKGTAHRRFAVTINLNDDFMGGELSFPEFGHRSLKPKPGCAVVFSCSILHTASPVTSGLRFAFLPFLYDDAAAELRLANLPYLADQPLKAD
jgi:peroxiredoxin/predicted 2-oxoglutarate/Fe(II)-dependent dioxygenase YbiX